MLKNFKRLASKTKLRTVLIVPFVVQIVGTVGLVGYLSFKNGQEAIAETRGSINATFLLCLGALAIATLLGIYTARWIASPIKRLNQASAAIASGDLDQTVELTSSPA